MPTRELERLRAIKRFLELELSEETELNDIVRLAAYICNQPTALITLVDEKTRQIKVISSFCGDFTPGSNAFCSHVLESGQMLIVENASFDPRFADDPLVHQAPNIRFYAGAPLTTHDGHHLGTLCVIGQETAVLSDQQKDMLATLARQAIKLLEFQTSVTVLKEQYEEAKRSELELLCFFKVHWSTT